MTDENKKTKKNVINILHQKQCTQAFFIYPQDEIMLIENWNSNCVTFFSIVTVSLSIHFLIISNKSNERILIFMLPQLTFITVELNWDPARFFSYMWRVKKNFDMIEFFLLCFLLCFVGNLYLGSLCIVVVVIIGLFYSHIFILILHSLHI